MRMDVVRRIWKNGVYVKVMMKLDEWLGVIR